MFAKIERKLRGLPGQIGCYIGCPATGDQLCYQADVPLVAASVIKLPVMAGAILQWEVGMRRCQEGVTIR